MCASSYVGPVLPQGTPWDNNAKEKETLLDSGGIYTQGEGITQTIGKCRPLTLGGTCCHTKHTPKRTLAIYPGMKEQASNTAWKGQWGDTKFNCSANILTVLPGNQGGGRAGGLPPLIATQQPLGPWCRTRLPALGILECLLRHLSLSAGFPLFPLCDSFFFFFLILKKDRRSWKLSCVLI